MSRSSSRGRVPNYQNETLLYNTIQDIKNMQTESYDTLKSIENYLIEHILYLYPWVAKTHHAYTSLIVYP